MDRKLTAARRQQHFNRQSGQDRARPRAAFRLSIAADAVFFGTTCAGSTRTLHNAERPTGLYRALHPRSAVAVHDIAAGFTVEDGRVAGEVLRVPVSWQALRRDHADSIALANRYAGVTQTDVDTLVGLLEHNAQLCRAYLASFDGDWRFLVELRGSSHAICPRKARPGDRPAAPPGSMQTAMRAPATCAMRCGRRT